MEVRMTPVTIADRLGARRSPVRRSPVAGLALPLLLLAAPVGAHEIETGSGVICDTREQAQRLALLLDDDAQAAIRTVNAESHDANACALATVAYVRGAKAGTARSKAGTFEIVEVLVVGVETKRGLRQASPAVYFTLFKIEERAA
jgi:hypothetical protein